MKTKRKEYFEKVWGMSKAIFKKKALAREKNRRNAAAIATEAAKNNIPAIQQIPHNNG